MKGLYVERISALKNACLRAISVRRPFESAGLALVLAAFVRIG
jgi:hypothetical protein